MLGSVVVEVGLVGVSEVVVGASSFIAMSLEMGAILSLEVGVSAEDSTLRILDGRSSMSDILVED